MENKRRQAEGTVYNFNVGGNSGYPNVQNMNRTAIQGQGQDQGQSQVQASYPGYIYPNLQPGYTYPKLNMIKGQGQQRQHQDQRQAPYGYNQLAWYPGARNNNLQVQLDYTYPNLNMGVNINMTQGQRQGQHQNQSQTPYGYNQAWYPGAGNNNLQVQPDYTYPNAPPAGSYYQLQPRPQMVEQPQAQRVFDAGRTGCSSRPSNVRNNNTFQAAGGRGRGRGRGRGGGRVMWDNKASSVANTGERLMRSSSQAQGHAEPQEQANAAVITDLSRKYSDGRFFVIKSNCRKNVVTSIRRGVWTSTSRGNRILNAAYSEARTTGKASACPVFLFFSVKGSGKFFGVAEMCGPVDFGASVNCWDRNWHGNFPVKWHIVKDVPYSQFRHITFNGVGNPNEVSVIHCRDAQQVEFEKGQEMLDIFKNYVGTPSLLDDVSRPTASSQQQQPPPPSPPQQHQEQPEEVEKQKGKEQPEEVEKSQQQQPPPPSPPQQHQEQPEEAEKQKQKEQPDEVEKSQQQPPPPSPPQQHQEQPEEVEKQKEKEPEEVEKEKEEAEAGREKVSEQYCTMNAICDKNSDQEQPETTEDSPNQTQSQEIMNTDKTQQIQVEKLKEEEARINKVSELQDCTKNASCDINTDKKQPESPNQMQLQEIPNTDHKQQTQMDTNYTATICVDETMSYLPIMPLCLCPQFYLYLLFLYSVVNWLMSSWR